MISQDKPIQDEKQVADNSLISRVEGPRGRIENILGVGASIE